MPQPKKPAQKAAPRKKPAYAHALIEHPDGRRFQIGELVPADLPGLADIIKGGGAGHKKPVNHVAVASSDSANSSERPA